MINNHTENSGTDLCDLEGTGVSERALSKNTHLSCKVGLLVPLASYM